MRLRCIVTLLGALVLGGWWAAPVAGDTPPAAVTDLVAPGTQRAALERLLGQPDPALQGVLLALKEGALYVWQEQVLIFGSDGSFRQLDGRPLLDKTGAPLLPEDGLEQVTLAQANLPLVQRILDVMDLFAA